MYFVVPLLFLQIVFSLAAKQGDFGIFKACKSNNSLKLKCSYAKCEGSPEFQCKLSSSRDPPFSTDLCNHTIDNHVTNYSSKTTSYKCTLTRKGRVENKTITVDYSIKKGKGLIGLCDGGVCTVGNPVVAFLWPLVIMMWTTLQDNY